MNPLITVYITNYNYGKFIKKAINSVLNQTFSNFELLIIDDGSTDNSREIIENYKNNPIIKIVYQQNKGLIVTNNIALRAAQGKYLIRLDADDYFDENALLIMVNKLESNPSLGLVYPDYYIVDEYNEILNLVKREPIDNVEVKDNPAHGACTMIRIDFLKEVGGYDENFNCQDGYYLWINFISRYKVLNINTPLFYYRRHSSNLTNNEDKIFNTRAEIKRKISFINKTYSQAVGIIPIRGANYTENQIAFKNFLGTSLIEWKLKSLLQTNMVKKIVVTTPDEKILNYIQENYSANSSKIILHKRAIEFARLNRGLEETIANIFEEYEKELEQYEYFFTADIRYPLIYSNTIDAAIKAIQIFRSNSLVTVRPESRIFFRRSNHGLVNILNQEKFTKLERDEFYRYSGGIILTSKSYFSSNKQLLGGTIGHVIIDEYSSLFIKDESDIPINELIAKKGIQSESIKKIFKV